MKLFSGISGALLALFIFNSIAMAQMIKIEAEGEVLNIPEVEAIIAKQKGKIEVLFTHSGMRPVKYKDVDLKVNDEIFMANGKKLTSVEQLKEIYEELETGAVLKIAVKRDGQSKIVSFVKADPEDLPKRKVRMEKVTDDDPDDEDKGEKKIIMKREKKKDE